MMICRDSFARFCAIGLISLLGSTATFAETPQEKLASDLATFEANAKILTLSTNLGSIIGSEGFCSITLNQDGIETWIAQNVPAERMDFPGHLQMAVMGQEAFNASMSASAKTAHCTAVEQAARENGLLK